MAEKVIGFQIRLEGSDKALKSISDLEKFIREANAALKDADVGSDTYEKLNKAIVDAKFQLSEVKREQREQVKALKDTAKASREASNAIEEQVEVIKKEEIETKAAAGSINALKQELREARVEFSALSAEQRKTESGEKLLKNIQQLDTEIKQLNKSQREQKQEVKKTAEVVKFADGSYRQLNAELVKSRREFKELSEEERENAQVGGVLLSRIQELDKELKSLDKSIGQNQRNVGNYESAFDGLGGAIQGGISGIAGFAFGAAGLGAAGDIIIDATQQLAELTEEFRVLRGSVEQLTGATGTELDEFTAKIRSISQVFGQDTDEVLRATNALSKQLGIDFTEALTAVEEGFISGANANGEFLDSISEYSTQVKAAGLTQQEFISILNLSAEQGVFSDKGIDTVKEFGLRIREQTTATRDALTGAFGEKFTDDLFNNINSGAITTADALKTVAGQLNRTELPARELQTVITDVFGGPGEDVGLPFIQSLENINTSYEELAGSATEYAKRQREILDLTDESNLALNALTKELQGGNDQFTSLSLQLKTTLFEGLTVFIRNIKFVATGIGNVVRSIRDFVEGNEILRNTIGLLINSFLTVGNVFGILFTQNLPAAFAGFQAAVAQGVENIKGFFNGLVVSAQLAGQRVNLALSIRSETQDRIKREIERLEGLQTTAAESGRTIGEAFNEAFNQVIDEQETPEIVPDPKQITQFTAGISEATKEVKELTKATKELNEEAEETEMIQRGIVDALQTRNFQAGVIQLEQEKEVQAARIDEIKSANDKILAENDRLRDEEIKREQEFQRQRQQAAFEAAQTISNAAFEIATIKAEQEKDRELQILDEQEAAELARFEGQEQKQEQIQQQFDQKREQLEQAAAKKDQQRAVSQAIINGALAITKVFATTAPPASFILAGLAAVTTAAQVATITAQKFARGGMIGGNSHANGGTIIEAERGEAIINKRSTAAFGPLLSAINEAGGGVRFQNGGIAGAPLPLPRISSAQNDFVGLINAIRQDVNATKQLALSVEQSVINLKVNLNTDELASEETKQVQLNNIRTL